MTDKVCPQCGTRYGPDHRFCFRDGAALLLPDGTADLVGSIIADRYHILEKLGDGGMGHVYLAEHVRMKRKSAVKVIRPGLVNDPIAMGRFTREAENASQISHPNVAGIYDFGETTDGLAYIAEEYIAGEPLSRILEREIALHPVRAADIICQTADGLSAAHALGILHRDLKPDNLMIGKTRTGTDLVKIVDFGIARVMTSDTQHVTSTGVVVGTPEYMSPEQFANDALDVRSDIYSLALVAFHVLTGQYAFQGVTSKERLVLRLTRPPRRLDEAKGDILWPPALQAAFDRALSSDPADRYDDVLAFAVDLYESIMAMPKTQTAEIYIRALANRLITPTRSLTPTDEFKARLDLRTRTGDGPRVHSSGTATPAVPKAAVPTPVAPMAAVGPSSSSSLSERSSPADTTLPAEPALSSHVGDSLSSAQSTPAFASIGVDSYDLGEPRAEPVVSLDSTPRRHRRAMAWAAAIATGATAAIVALVASSSGNRGAGDGANGTAPSPVVSPPAAPTASQAPPVTVDTIADTTTTPATVPILPTADLLQRAEPAVLALISGPRRGTAFLADSTGLVLTAAHLLGTDTLAQVQPGPEGRIPAVLVHRDRARDVAVLAISMKRCRRCSVLSLARTDAAGRPALGDSVVTLGAGVTPSERTRSGAVKSIDSMSVSTTAGLAARSAAGGPVVTRAGAQAIALNLAAGPRSNTLVPAGALNAALVAARDRLAKAGLTPPDTLIASWPLEPYATARIARVRADRSFDATPYRARRQERPAFDLFVMTPPVAAWREERARAALNDRKVARIDFPFDRVDPLQKWSAWDGYVREARAVVIFSVTPVQISFPFYEVTELRDIKSGDFQSLQLLRDGKEISPLETARLPAFVNDSAHMRANRRVPSQGVVVFRHDAFAPNPDRTQSRFEVRIIDATRPAGPPEIIALPDALIRAIQADFADYKPRR